MERGSEILIKEWKDICPADRREFCEGKGRVWDSLH